MTTNNKIKKTGDLPGDIKIMKFKHYLRGFIDICADVGLVDQNFHVVYKGVRYCVCCRDLGDINVID